MTEIINKHLKSLIFGIIHNSQEQVFKAHRDLYGIGRAVILILEEHIFKQSWKDIQHGPQLAQLAGMLNLIHDIDETQAKLIGEKIRKAGCSDKVDRRISAITTFTLDNFHAYEIGGVKIYQSKELGKQSPIESRMRKWLSIVPKIDMEQVERIYLIPQSKEDHRGYYTPILCKIVVEWDAQSFFLNPLSWFECIFIEKTLYHEIGHHAHNHTFGQDPDQEKEADKYAYRLLFKRHPIKMNILKKIAQIFMKRKTKN